MTTVTGYINPSATAERIALAIVTGAVPAELRDAAIEQLRMASRAAEVERDAAALRAYRNGEPVAAWPRTAPWAGF